MGGVMEYLRGFSFGTVLLRLLLAVASGFAVGYGRARKRRNAGLRTYILTSIGAALTVLISLYEYQMLTGDWSFAAELAEMKFDGGRFAAQVVNGIGFLAAGTILSVSHQQVSGLTTAIGLFAAACMGLAAGAGFYECVLVAILFIVIAMELLQPVEISYKRRLRNVTIFVEFNSIEDVGVITNMIQKQGGTIFDIDIERAQHEDTHYPSAIMILKLDKEHGSHSAMLSSIAELPCVYGVQELIS